MKERNPHLSFAAGVSGIALLVFAYLALTWRNFAGVTRVIEPFTRLFCDFVDYYYPMGDAVFRTGVPVDGYLYSPFIAILLAAFPPLGLSTSLVLWGILLGLFVILYLLLFRRLVPAGLPVQLLFAALALSSFPLVINLLGGQVSVFIVVPLLGMLVLDERGLRAAGAGLLAFAVSFKFYPILFVAPFAARRDTRFLMFAAAACGTLLVVVPGVLLGAGGMLRFYGGLLDSFRDSAWVTANPHSQFFPHLVLRLTGTTETGEQGLLPILHVISYGAAAANMGLIFLVQRARLRHADLWSFQVVFLTLPFVFKTSWPHDFVFLSFTQALLVWRLWGREKPAEEDDYAEKRSHASKKSGARVAITLCLLVPSIVFSNIVFFNLFNDFTGYGFLGFMFWANLLVLIAVYLQLLPPALRRVHHPRAA